MEDGDGRAPPPPAPAFLDLCRLHPWIPHRLRSGVAPRPGMAPRRLRPRHRRRRLHRDVLERPPRPSVRLSRPVRRTERPVVLGRGGCAGVALRLPERHLCRRAGREPLAMSAYLPRAGDALLAALAVLSAILALALLVTHIPRSRSARTAAWALVVLAVGAAHCVTSTQPAGLRMLVVIAALLFAMKAVVSVEARARDGTRLPLRRWLAFATLWPGMRAALFAHLRPGRPGAARLLWTGLVHTALGASLFVLARLTWQVTASAALSSLLLLPALSLLLHFGAFDLGAGLWRRAGADVRPLFRPHLRSPTLADFWSRRWNLAFSEMTSLVVYRPLAESAGRRA